MPVFKSLLVLQYILSGSDVLARAQTTTAAACTSTIAPRHAAPSLAAGWRAAVVANGLKSPRGILFDGNGALLVVEQSRGISRLAFNGDAGSCVRVNGDPDLVVDDPTVSLTAVLLRTV